MTPWLPIVLALLATLGSGWLVASLTRNAAFGVAAGALVLALALTGLAQIATVAYAPAAVLAVVGLAALVLGWGSRRP